MKCFVYNVIGIVLLLSGCAGTSSEFTCNAKTTDACLTMQQANEIAQRKEKKSLTKSGVNALLSPSERGMNSSSMIKEPQTKMSLWPAATRAFNHPAPKKGGIQWVRALHAETAVSIAGQRRSSRPSRVNEQLAMLRIAPYADKDDIYHPPSTVMFVVAPAHWVGTLFP